MNIKRKNLEKILYLFIPLVDINYYQAKKHGKLRDLKLKGMVFFIFLSNLINKLPLSGLSVLRLSP